MDRLNEARRQAAVLQALASDRAPTQPPGATLPGLHTPLVALAKARMRTDTAGLRAYQLNAQATAQRVLASTYPTVGAMLGAETLDALALILWSAHPPERGDLAEWGGALPELLARHPDLQAWPWLADCARLDWARHLSARAADTAFEPDSMLSLGQVDPASLRLQLHAHVLVLCSRWPLLALWQAHQLPPDQQAQACAEALASVPAPQAPEGAAQALVIWRPNWAVQMSGLPAPQAGWMLALGQAPEPFEGMARVGAGWPQDTSTPTHLPVPAARNLADLLAQAPADFDFADWLAAALQHGWISRVAHLDGPRSP